METTPAVEESEVSVEKKLLTRKSSGSISSPTTSVTGSPRHHRSPRRAASERRRSRHHHHHHHHHHERKGSLYSASTSSHHGGADGRRTSRVGDRRVSHTLGDNIPKIPSRTNSISSSRKLSATDSTSLPAPQRKQSERQSSNGPYMSPGLNMAGGYRTPGAEILIASLIIAVGLVALIVSFSTGQKIWLIVGSVCSALGGMFMILGLCWYCATVKEKPPDEANELRVVTHGEIRAKLLHHHSSVKSGQDPEKV